MSDSVKGRKGEAPRDWRDKLEYEIFLCVNHKKEHKSCRTMQKPNRYENENSKLNNTMYTYKTSHWQDTGAPNSFYRIMYHFLSPDITSSCIHFFSSCMLDLLAIYMYERLIWTIKFLDLITMSVIFLYADMQM